MHRCELMLKNLGFFAIVRFDTSLQRDCVKLLTNKSHVRFNLVLLHTDIFGVDGPQAAFKEYCSQGLRIIFGRYVNF